MSTVAFCHPERSEGFIRDQPKSCRWSSPAGVAAEVTRLMGESALRSSLLTSAATSDDSDSVQDDNVREDRRKGGGA